MFTDPQSVTIDSVAKSLPRVTTGETKSVYSYADKSYVLTISHQNTKSRARRMVRLDHRAIVADPLTAVNDYENLGVYIVIDEPEYGFSDGTVEDVVNGLIGFLTAANIAKVLGDEH